MGEFGDSVGEIRVEDLAEPIRAWRVWRVTSFGEMRWLTSSHLTQDGWCGRRGNCPWPPEGIEARCYCAQMQAANRFPPRRTYPDDRPMHAECPGPPTRRQMVNSAGYGCGIYGMRERDELLETHWACGAHVLGVVELGGRVWEHDRGWRAQYARVHTLETLLPEYRHAGDAALRALRVRYGCE